MNKVKQLIYSLFVRVNLLKANPIGHFSKTGTVGDFTKKNSDASLIIVFVTILTFLLQNWLFVQFFERVCFVDSFKINCVVVFFQKGDIFVSIFLHAAYLNKKSSAIFDKRYIFVKNTNVLAYLTRRGDIHKTFYELLTNTNSVRCTEYV
jgi:hypothetical protein